MWMRKAFTVPSVVRRYVDAERLAGVTIAAVMTLAVVDAAGRTRPLPAADGYDLTRLSAKWETRKARADDGREVDGESGLSGSRMMALLEERGPQDAAARAAKAFHRPVAVILDATGSRALHPNRAAAQPLDIKLISRVEEVATVPASTGAAATPATAVADVSAAVSGPQAVADVPATVAARKAIAAKPLRARVRAGEANRVVAAARTRIARVVRSTAHIELTPGEFARRSLRGPG